MSESAAGAYDRWVQVADPPMVVVTAARGDERSGCLAGFHTQLSIEPRRHLVGVSRVNHTFPVASAASHLGVHLLGADQQDLARLFGEETGDEIDKFGRCRWAPGPHGVPVLEGVPGWFVGAIVGRVEGGDHLGLLLEPVAGAVRGDEGAAVGIVRLGGVEDLEPGHPA